MSNLVEDEPYWKNRRTCLETAKVDGLLALCTKNKEHADSADPAEREHHDPSTGRSWVSKKEE